MAKKITLENLAEKMGEGFKRVDERFDKVDERFKEAEKHTDKKIDEKIDDLGRMINRSFNEVYQRLDKLEKNDQVIIKQLEGIVYRKEFEELENRIKIIEEALAIKK